MGGDDRFDEPLRIVVVGAGPDQCGVFLSSDSVVESLLGEPVADELVEGYVRRISKTAIW